MANPHRRLLIDATLIGVLLTLIVAAADALGWLAPLERWLYDERALRCQHWMPPPTDRLVHVDIDDPSVASIGRWPWKRTDVADIVDELHRAGAKAVGLDLTFSEPQEPQLVKVNKSDLVVDHDARLAEALRASADVVVAAVFPFRREEDNAVYPAVKALLAGNLELTEPQVVAALRAGGMNLPGLEDRVRANLYPALRDALAEKIVASGVDAADTKALRKALLPGTDPDLDTVAMYALRAAQVRAAAATALRRHSVALPAELPVVTGHLADAPLPELSRAAASAGFVDYTQSADARIRAVPLLLRHDGVVYPQFGMALAWQLLGADPKGLKVTESAVTVPRGPLGDLVVPVRTAAARELFAIGRDVPLSANLSWFGGHEWSTMYARPGAAHNQHVPAGFVFDACRVRRRIESNHALASDRWQIVISDELFEEFLKELARDDVDGHMARIDRVLASAVMPPADDPKRAEADAAVATLRQIREATPRLAAELANRRRQLREIFDDKAVLVGWTATGSIADFVPTSLHPRCPGVVLHGVVFNQVMTGEVWRTLPQWVTLLVTLAVGLLATAAVSFLSPSRALAVCVLLLAAYALANGYLLFDYGNLIVGAAGPLVAVGAVFTGGTAAKLALERWERARITRRFSSYVDPKLVDYVLKHPDQAHFEGQIREMTVVFCDVAGFTKLTETRGSETVQMLNELWGVVVPVIQRRGGLINKFLGDGIMFFYGAPEQSEHHAADAVATVLEVREALDRFNADVAAARGWPALGLRFGISTGPMVVGDAGYTTSTSGMRADYTVLGDNVNLGSRLEAANKAVGTGILVTERTWELAKDGGFLFRPVGKLCVVGKKTGVMTYEPLGRAGDANGQRQSLAAATRAVVDSFMAGRLAECLAAIDRMETEHGRTKLTELYRDRCDWFLRDPSPEPFDCQITLTEK